MRAGLVVYGDLDKDISGGNLYDSKLLRYLHQQSHDVHIISLPNANYVHHLTDNLKTSLLDDLAETKVDILIEDELIHPSVFHLNHQLRQMIRQPIASVVHHLRSSEHHPKWQNSIYRLIEKRYLQTIDAFIFNSETTRQSVESLLGENTMSIVATPGGDRLGSSSSPETIAARSFQDGPLRLLFVGNLIRRKGLHHLLSSLTHLTDCEWTLNVIGNRYIDPSYVSELEKQSKAGHISSRLTFHGKLSDKQLSEHYRTSHVMVVPSTYEGFGIVSLEAMGFGLPVIASTAGASNEIVSHGVNGFLVSPIDYRHFSHQLRRLAKDRALLNHMSLTARENFQQHSTWRDCAHAIETFLLQIIRTYRKHKHT